MGTECVKAPNPTRAASFVVPRNQQARDRQQSLGRGVVEGDAEDGIVVSPPGCPEHRRVQGQPQPCDVPSRPKEPARGQAQLDVDEAEGRQSLCGGDAQTAQSNIRATSEWRDALPVRRRESQRGVESDAFAALSESTVVSHRDSHFGFPCRILVREALSRIGGRGAIS